MSDLRGREHGVFSPGEGTKNLDQQRFKFGVDGAHGFAGEALGAFDHVAGVG